MAAEDDLDVLAGEYVLGTLAPDERAAVERRLLDNPDLAAARGRLGGAARASGRGSRADHAAPRRLAAGAPGAHGGPARRPAPPWWQPAGPLARLGRNRHRGGARPAGHGLTAPSPAPSSSPC